MNRNEHLEWCKQRAREYLDQGDAANAVASMMSDLGKHEETARLTEGALGALWLFAVRDLESARRYVEGFN